MSLIESIYTIWKKHTASVAQKKAKRAAAERVYERYLSEGLLLDLTEEILEAKRMLVEHIETDHRTSRKVGKVEGEPTEGVIMAPSVVVAQPISREEQIRRIYHGKYTQ